MSELREQYKAMVKNIDEMADKVPASLENRSFDDSFSELVLTMAVESMSSQMGAATIATTLASAIFHIHDLRKELEVLRGGNSDPQTEASHSA